MPSDSSFELSNQQICKGLSPFAIIPNDTQMTQIRKYTLLLLKWNRLVNLTSITDPTEIVTRHFGESIYASKLLPVENCRLADVGTGPGFPGLALKIAFPGIHVTLIDSNKRKCAFLSEVIRELGLADVQIRSERFEQIRPETVRANIISSRAVGEFRQLLRWSAIALVHRGHLVLWVGGEDTARIVRDPAWCWQPAVRLPDSQRRFILIGRPIDEIG